MPDRIKTAAAALALVAGLVAPAVAQKAQAWDSADGGLHLTIPSGWQRNDQLIKPGDEFVLDVSPTDPAAHAPGVHCRLRPGPTGQAQPGLTQPAMNDRFRAGADDKT